MAITVQDDHQTVSATLRSERLSDGSKLFDIVIRQSTCQLTLNCIDERKARVLLSALADATYVMTQDVTC